MEPHEGANLRFQIEWTHLPVSPDCTTTLAVIFCARRL